MDNSSSQESAPTQNMENSQIGANSPVVDESSLRQYFRRVLNVSAGGGRKQLRQARDRISGRLRERLLQTQGAERERIEKSMVLVNTAFDCLSRQERFLEYLEQINKGEANFLSIEELPPELGAPVKPPSPRLLERRQAHTQERVERIASLIADAVRSAGLEESHRQTKMDGALPDPDLFYETIYDVARNAGRRVKKEELALADKSGKFDISDAIVEELDSLIEDTADIVAHKEYDRLEYLAAQSEPPKARNKTTALVLASLILFLVGFYGWYAMTNAPTMVKMAEGDGKSKLILPNSNDTQQAEFLFDPGFQVRPLKELTVIDKLVSTAGFAGVSGPPVSNSSAGAASFNSALKAAVEGRSDEAVRLFTEASGSENCRAEALYCIGTIQAGQGRYEDAIATFSKCLILNPGIAQAFYNRALCHHALANSLVHEADTALVEKCSRHLQAALKNYSLALRVDPRLSQALYNRAWTYYLLGKTAEAIADLDGAPKVTPMFTAAAEYNRNLIINAVSPGSNLPVAAVPPQAPVGPAGPAGPAR